MANIAEEFLLIDFRFFKAKLTSSQTSSSVIPDNSCFILDGEGSRPKWGVRGHCECGFQLFLGFEENATTDRASKKQNFIKKFVFIVIKLKVSILAFERVVFNFSYSVLLALKNQNSKQFISLISLQKKLKTLGMKQIF